jgi:hypothetical protein
MCLGCHQGRASGANLESPTANTVTQTPTDYPSFDYINTHYYAAAATLFGSLVNAGYEYAGNTYRGQNTFVGLHTQDGRTLVDCIGCHMNAADAATDKQRHTFLPQVEDCNLCHSGDSFESLSGSPGDNYNEINILKGDFVEAIQAYAINDLPQPSPLFYDGSTYPYWFKDNGMGASFANRYRDFDLNMVRGAFNYGVADKDPGAYIHNGRYIEQILFDSICALGGSPSIPVPDRGIDCP